MNILRLFSKQKEVCQHDKNWVYKRWIESNTPMMRFNCLDCGFGDAGMVYTDATDEEWIGTTIMEDGIKSERVP